MIGRDCQLNDDVHYGQRYHTGLIRVILVCNEALQTNILYRFHSAQRQLMEPQTNLESGSFSNRERQLYLKTAGSDSYSLTIFMESTTTVMPPSTGLSLSIKLIMVCMYEGCTLRIQEHEFG